MSGILGKKVGMTRLIQEDGKVVPITVVECSSNEVTQVKTVEKDGYLAVVLGYSQYKKPTKTRKFKHLREFTIKEDDIEKYQKGSQITVGNFAEGEVVKITSTSKGKGFQGVIRRHNFSRGPESHGSHHHREPGSIGACAKPGRVHRGKKLPGRMGGEKTTISRVEIAHLDSEKNIICLKGPLPGPNGTLITIRKN